MFEIPCEEGAKYVHVGVVTGTPVAPFLGVDPPTGRSFKVMSLDVHWVVDGKIRESWLVTEWLD